MSVERGYNQQIILPQEFQEKEKVSIAQQLRVENQYLVRAAVLTPFNQGLIRGNLPQEHLMEYRKQDVPFLTATLEVDRLLYPRMDPQAQADFIHILADVRAALNKRKALIGDLHVEPNEATREYIDFLRSSTRGSVGASLASLAPCYILYPELGKLMLEASPQNHQYSDVIMSCTSLRLVSHAARFERLLDRYADDTPVVHENYRKAMEYEIRFFSSAVAGKPGTYGAHIVFAH